jgi:UDP-N-acetylmuramate dehydrogenase
LSRWQDHLPKTRGKLLLNEALAPFTWLRVGGPADVLFLPEDEDDLAAFLKALDPAVPVMAIGVGSNLLVRDGGVVYDVKSAFRPEDFAGTPVQYLSL